MLALFSELRRYLDENFSLNAKTMLNEAIKNTRLSMSEAEKNQFYDKYLKRMRLSVAEDGQVTIEWNT
jgi:hypothetical protein